MSEASIYSSKVCELDEERPTENVRSTVDGRNYRFRITDGGDLEICKSKKIKKCSECGQQKYRRDKRTFVPDDVIERILPWLNQYFSEGGNE